MKEIARQVDRPLVVVAGRCSNFLKKPFMEALQAEGLSCRVVLPDLSAIAGANLEGSPVPLVPEVLSPLKELVGELTEAQRNI
jgi:CO dehydrogenase nickel-insertion accessory protein CooC1